MSGDKYVEAAAERQKHVDAILNSPSPRKIVVAGPGTGKTHLFKKVLEGKGHTLTLTFVNSLVEDLSLELCGISEVRTLHSFARGILGRAKVFPKLSRVIAEDALILLKQKVDFEKIFHDREDKNEHIAFYKRRKDYYDKHYGYSDLIFAAVKYLELNPAKIPVYDQIVVDEFQDFNKLEVSLIDLLAGKSPILLAGDDDQALYEFKSASAHHIRERHGDAFPDYASFTLPYCSRSTRVIVNAANDVIANAGGSGHLKGRVAKEYLYFEDQRKDVDCANYPKLIHTTQFARKIPWFIEKQIGEIAEDVKRKFEVLVISPTTTQCRLIADSLREKGFQNVDYTERPNDKPDLFDGLKVLLDDDESNLGWRIVSRCVLDADTFSGLLAATKEETKSICELVDGDCRTQVRRMLRLLRKAIGDSDDHVEHLDEFLKGTEFDPSQLARDSLKNAVGSRRMQNPGIRGIPIKITTVQSSKGLAADFVFIANFDERYFVSDGGAAITDRDICGFLVALTRARKKVFLISSGKEVPTFLKWIKPERFEALL
jgi:superfamily I DNA/RNA helicase